MTDLAALVATRMEKFKTFRTGVSMSVHTPNGPSTLTTGTLGKTIVPSGITTRKEKKERKRKKVAEKARKKGERRNENRKKNKRGKTISCEERKRE